MEIETTSKRTLLETMLNNGMVSVVIDPRRQGVRLPRHLLDTPQVRLNLSQRFGRPMQLDDWGVRATLTFSGVPFDCALPWHSIYVIFSHSTGEPTIFGADFPTELLEEMTRAVRQSAKSATAPAKTERPSLNVVRGADPPEKPDRPSRRHLRVVK